MPQLKTSNIQLLSKPLKRSLLFIITAFSLSACVSIIDFNTEDQRELIIYGKLTNSEIYDQGITVRRSDLNTTAGLAIGNASVEVIDENGQVFPYRFSDASERYVPVTPFVGQPGVSYQARVTVVNETYTSTPQRMPVAGAQDSTYFRVEQVTVITNIGAEIQRYVVKIFTDSQIDANEEPIYMKWDVEQVSLQQEISLPAASFPFYAPRNCYIYEEFLAENILLFDGALVNTQSIEGQEIAEIAVDNSFKNLRGFGVIQSSFSRDALEYWQRVEDVSNRVGSIFEIPPAPIPGNFSNVDDPEDMPLGFFEVAKMDTTGTFLTADDIPVALGLNGEFLDCTVIPGQLDNIPFNCFPCVEARGIPEACYNCLTIPNSTLIRPSYLD